jgi:hypothetical protein
MVLATLGVVVGSVLYRLVIYVALLWDFVKAQDMKLISAVLVIAALVMSQSKTLRSGLSKLSPWRPKADLPEPMTIVPNQFSPLASADTVSAGPENRGAEGPRTAGEQGVVRLPGDEPAAAGEALPERPGGQA